MRFDRCANRYALGAEINIPRRVSDAPPCTPCWREPSVRARSMGLYFQLVNRELLGLLMACNLGGRSVCGTCALFTLFTLARQGRPGRHQDVSRMTWRTPQGVPQSLKVTSRDASGDRSGKLPRKMTIEGPNIKQKPLNHFCSVFLAAFTLLVNTV